MGRKAFFRPRIATTNDMTVWGKVETMYGGDEGNAATRQRVVAEFVSFHRMNSAPLVQTLRLWAGAAFADGLKWSTIDTYSSYITKIVLCDLTPSERMEWRVTKKIISAAHADEDCGGARTCCAEELRTVLGALGIEARRAVAAIAYTGARLADIRRWRTKQMIIRKNAIAVQVRVSKNRRKRNLRRILRIENISGMLGIELDSSLQEIRSNYFDPELRLFANVNVTWLNAQIAVACHSFGCDKLTTYSFRKFFIASVIRYYNYDWSRIITKTLHCKIDVVAAHYDSWNDESTDFA